MIANTHPAVPQGRAWPGRLAIAGIVIIATLLLHFRGQGPAPGNALPASVSGFRVDAWMLPADDLLGFVRVPSGPFVMGNDKTSDPQAFDNERWSPEKARGDVALKEFFIGRFEVTAAQFQVFAAATNRRAEPQALALPPNHPAAFVSWPDAVAYCQWLESRMKTSGPAALKAQLDAGWRITLPSEAEWEKAARSADGRRYPWGEDPLRERANIQTAGAVPVGSILCPECAYGLSDMSGNVWEWTRSPYQPYPYDPSDDANTTDADALWVMRGGSFNDAEQMARGSARGAADPGVRRAFIGFRIVLTPN